MQISTNGSYDWEKYRKDATKYMLRLSAAEKSVLQNISVQENRKMNGIMQDALAIYLALIVQKKYDLRDDLLTVGRKIISERSEQTSEQSE